MSTLSRRTVLKSGILGIAGASASIFSLTAQEAYPSRTISFICAFPAGSGADVLVRYFADKIGKLSNATIIVENKGGAAGNIATEHVVRSKPDGYTVYIHAGNSVASNMHLYKNPPFNATRDLRVAATINRQAFMLSVAAKSPYKTVAELTEAMKLKGEKATYGIATATGKVMGVLYKQAAGLEAVEVSYRSGPDLVNDMLGGIVDFGINDPVIALSEARKGTLRLLAVASGERMNSAPDVPTMQEAGVPGVDLNGWFAVMVPTGTPEPVIGKINEWFKDVLQRPETAKFLNENGGDVFISSPAEGQALLEKSVKDWGEYVRIAKIPQN